MNIRITDEAMTSDTTPHGTRSDADGWAVTWLPGRVLTRNQAITAMVLAETVTGNIGDHTDKRWLFIESWANELGMTGADAVGKISYYGVDLPASGRVDTQSGHGDLRAVPGACPIGQSSGVSHGQSRIAIQPL